MPPSGVIARLKRAAIRSILPPALLLSALSGCAGAPMAPVAHPPPLYLAVSSELTPLIDQMEPYWPSPVSVQVTSTEEAIESLVLGYANAALLWGPKPQLEEPFMVELVASDALAVIVHPRNRVGPLERADLRRLFSGQVQDWAELGQTLGAVQVVARERGSGVRLAAEHQFMNGEDFASTALIATTSTAVLNYVASTPGAIGLVPAGSLREGVRALAVEGERPEPQKIRDGLYDLMEGVWVAYVPGEPGQEIVSLFFSEDGLALLDYYYAAPELGVTR